MGPLFFALCIVLLPTALFETLKMRAAVGTAVWMTLWWITSPVDYVVTAFLPIALNALIPMVDMTAVIGNYASETILLLLGASILTASWEKAGLDQQIAAYFLRLIGDSLRSQIIFWFLLTTLLSAILPNVVVCTAITSVAVSILNYIGEREISKSRPASKILLAIVYGTGVGGLASPLGGAMNLVIIDYIQKLTGQEYIYSIWVVKFLPVMILLVVSNLLFMIRNVGKEEKLGGVKDYFIQKQDQTQPMDLEKKCLLGLFLLATVLAFARQSYQALLPGLKPAYVFMICAILSFLITDKEGNRLQNWKSVQPRIVWELLYIFAGGLALGTLINDSGAAGCLGNIVASLGLSGGAGTVFIFITLTLLLSDVTSNTATAAIAVPVVISIIQGIGKNPLPYVYIVTIGVNLSYMFPTSIRAIPVGYGLDPKCMLSEGWKMSVMVILEMTVLCYALLKIGFL